MSASVCGGAFEGAFHITNDAGGSGYFLFEGTGNGTPTGNEFYISSGFAVTPDTTYTVQFNMASADGYGLAQVEPDINGTVLGSPASGVLAAPPAFRLTKSHGLDIRFLTVEANQEFSLPAAREAEP